MLDESSKAAGCTLAHLVTLVVASVLRGAFAVAEESNGFEGRWGQASHPTVSHGVWMGVGHADKCACACWLRL